MTPRIKVFVFLFFVFFSLQKTTRLKLKIFFPFRFASFLVFLLNSFFAGSQVIPLPQLPLPIPPSESRWCCVGDCAANYEDQGGDHHHVLPASHLAQAQAEGNDIQQRSAFAEVGIRFQPCFSEVVGISMENIRIRGILTGWGGGPVIRGEVDVRYIVRNETTDTEIYNDLLYDAVEDGVAGDSHDTEPDELIPIHGGLLQLNEGDTYIVMLRIHVQKFGLNSQADFLDGEGFGVSFECIRITPVLGDSDGDGINDIWETGAIDIDCDGNNDFNLQSLGTDYRGNPIVPSPDHIDIFVEVDYFDCNQPGGDCPPGDGHTHQPIVEALDIAVQAFANAPVNNPDGEEGINLWVIIDEALPHRMNCNLDGICFDPIKANRFGTPNERNNPLTLQAKALFFHYSLWAHNLLTDSSTSGRAEPTGNDFIVSLGSWPGQVGTFRQQAGTFMHELGHNLGLGHGGGDGINCKPNYPSVMSYVFQTRGIPSFSLIPPTPPNIFDYSRNVYPNSGFLRENNNSLNENIGIQDQSFLTFFGPPLDLNGIDDNGDGDFTDDWLRGIGSGPIDWNNNGNPFENVSADINNLEIGGCGPSPGQTLNGYNDWANLVYNFRPFPNAADGHHELDDIEELNFETDQIIQDRFWYASIDTIFEYPAKIICGLQSDPEDLRLARGGYASTINIYNPNYEPVEFRKTLVLSYPPEEQRAGERFRIGYDILNPGEALKTDCNELELNIFDNEFPEPYIEGYIVVESPLPLNVDGVYTTSDLSVNNLPQHHSSLEIERIEVNLKTKRRSNNPNDNPSNRPDPQLPDLIPIPPFGEPSDPPDYPMGFCAFHSVSDPPWNIAVIIRNQGDSQSGNAIIRLEWPNFNEQFTVEQNIQPLIPGNDQTIVFPVLSPSFLDHDFQITVDATDTVTESNENNNTISSSCPRN